MFHSFQTKAPKGLVLGGKFAFVQYFYITVLLTLSYKSLDCLLLVWVIDNEVCSRAFFS